MQIINVHLETKGWGIPDKGSCYLVFWWRTLAIGHLYVDASESHNIDSAAKKNWISGFNDTIIFFAEDKQLSDRIIHSFTINDHQAFCQGMEEAFNKIIQFQFPSKVPISVIICTRDRSEDLNNCLKSLMRQKCLPEEIIVIDNGRLNTATKAVVDQYVNTKYFQEFRPGLSYARNKGITQASAPILAWLDDDVETDDLWLANLWKSFEDKDTTAVTGLVLAAELDTESQEIFEEHWSFNRGYLNKTFTHTNYLTIFPPKVWEIGAGANMAFRRTVLNEVGYFDVRLGAGTAGCSEDSEMWFRILNAKHTITYCPQAIVFHKHRRTMHELKRQLFFYMRGHAAAALFQSVLNRKAGYRKHIFHDLPSYYLMLFRIGFPEYKSRFSTIGIEIRGLFAGILYYYLNRRKNRGKISNSSNA